MAMYSYKTVPVFGKALTGTILFSSATEPAKAFAGTDLYITPVLEDLHRPVLTLSVNRKDPKKSCSTGIILSRCSFLTATTGEFTNPHGGYSEHAVFWQQHGVKVEGRPYVDKVLNSRRVPRYRYLDIEIRGAKGSIVGEKTDLPPSFQEVVRFLETDDETASLRIVVQVNMQAVVPEPKLKYFLELCERFGKRMKEEEASRKEERRQAEEVRRGIEEEERLELAAQEGESTQPAHPSPAARHPPEAPASPPRRRPSPSKRPLDCEGTTETSSKKQKSSVRSPEYDGNTAQIMSKLTSLFALKKQMDGVWAEGGLNEVGMQELLAEIEEAADSLRELSAARKQMMSTE